MCRQHAEPAAKEPCTVMSMASYLISIWLPLYAGYASDTADGRETCSSGKGRVRKVIFLLVGLACNSFPESLTSRSKVWRQSTFPAAGVPYRLTINEASESHCHM